MAKYIIALLLFVSSVRGSAQNNSDIDPMLDDTTYKAIDSTFLACVKADGSTLGLIGCSLNGEKAWNDRMEMYYKLLSEQCATAKDSQLLLKSQTSWEEFRSNEKLLYQKSLFDRDGTMWRYVDAYFDLYLARSRALQLQYYYQVTTQH